MSVVDNPGFWKSVAKDLGVQNALAGTLVAVLVSVTRYAIFRA